MPDYRRRVEALEEVLSPRVRFLTVRCPFDATAAAKEAAIAKECAAKGVRRSDVDTVVIRKQYSEVDDTKL